MGASFRNVGQIGALAGCDLLTISPDLLAKLQASDAALPRLLDAHDKTSTDDLLQLDEISFRFMHNQDAMASDKLGEGIRAFVKDTQTLEVLIASAI